MRVRRAPPFGAFTGGANVLLVQPRQMQFSAKYIF
jgi:hypothetical protein